MTIGIPKERVKGENRVALTPDIAGQLVKKGFRCMVEKDAGLSSYFDNSLYKNAGTEITDNRHELYAGSDVIIKIDPPFPDEFALMKPESVLISFLAGSISQPLFEMLSKYRLSAIAIDAIPRITKAQGMDVLSSQSNIGGYKAVILAAFYLGKIFPLMMTAAGTLKPVKVFIIGAGVAGLQAAATAKRLGALVEVTDVRPETKEQVESVGAKFIGVNAADDIKVSGGYVKEISKELIQRQKELLEKHVAQADIVITTALVIGKKAPVLVTASMIKKMRLGSVIVDMAAGQGGNCEGTVKDEVIVKDGVTIIGNSNLPGTVPLNASELYAKNVSSLLLYLTEKGKFKWDMEDEITKAVTVARDGKILFPYPAAMSAVNAGK